MDRYAVMGNPIAHSKSPKIHQMFAAQTGQKISYEAILVELGKFPDAIADFRAAQGKGLNVTVPFKEEAWRLVDARLPRAEKAGAVNTIVFSEKDGVLGDNTDGTGLVNDIQLNLGISLQRKHVLLVGAGGAVRGVLGPILAEKVGSVTIANRTVSKAETLAKIFSNEGILKASDFESLRKERFDLIINGTAASLHGEVPAIPDEIIEGSVCYDMMYGKENTVFMQWANLHGAKNVYDGLGMLVCQAAESFFLWRGVRPDTQPVIDALRGS